jgi:hypothetical protein
LDRLGEQPADRKRVADLCVADRRFLLRALQLEMGESRRWYQSRCSGCGETFDFPLDLAALPAPKAGPGYPCATLKLGRETLRFRLPTGADQEAVTETKNEDDARLELIRRCWEPASGRKSEAAWKRLCQGGAALWERVEAALEAVSPDPVSELQAACPHCERMNRVEIGPGDWLRGDPDRLLRDVHQLALHYHWSEAEILGLGRPRRERYLQLIDTARGMAQ